MFLKITSKSGGMFLKNHKRTGYSSYQIYIWVKEHMVEILNDEKLYSNWKNIGELIDTIDRSSLNGIGGGGVCHYGCVPPGIQQKKRGVGLKTLKERS